ncbi:collagenase [Kitasatospora putterlickiae]|uniref:microbial collagenase n=1 Tax=Kitasatospora putterlickiae TaxID=221725 RepID=A0ABN1Y8T6_9ACTN
MLLRTRLSMLAAGVVACCATATAVLPTQALAAPSPAAAPAPTTTTAPAGPVGPAAPKAPTTTTASEEPGEPAAPLDQALIGATSLLEEPAEAAAPAQFKSLAVQSCTPADFAALTGADLVAFIKSSTPECINSLYQSAGADASIFNQARMLSVAAALKDVAATYSGDNTAGIAQLVKYLQVGYYIQFNFPAAGAYTPALTDAVTAALDTFFAGTRWRDVSENNGRILKEVVWLTDSANVQARYLGVYKRILDEYDNTYNQFPQMRSAVNSVLYYPLWEGYRNKDFVRALAADPALINSLADFAVNHRDLISGPHAVLDTNAGNDLAKFAGMSPAAEAVAKPLIKKVLDSAPLLSPFGKLYVYTARQAAYFNYNQCSYYGICDLRNKLISVILPNQLVCDNRILQAQSLSAAELATVCESLRKQDALFHSVSKDNGPIPNQYAKTVTFGIFANKADYTTYSTAIYGNGTDNGGQTVMDATDPNKMAVTVMYQKAWNVNDPARVWNLNHEYAHYLDSIYNLKGNYDTQSSVPNKWWVEGLAEYVSYTHRGATDVDAMNQAAKHTYKLSTLFQNTYENADSTRIYPWGYLSVRYMLEKHPADVQAMLERFRVADYTGGYAVYNNLGTSYDADFDAWLDACVAGACLATGPTSLFDTTVNGATVSMNERSVQTGTGRITGYRWDFGDGTYSDERSPTHTYGTPGAYTVALTTTDDTGRIATTQGAVTTTALGLPTCTEQRTDAMARNCARPGRAATAGSTDYLYVYLPAGTTTLKVNTLGGTGTAYLYYNDNTWASPKAYTAASTAAGTTQSITVTNPTAGYRYLSLYGATDFSGVTVTTEF